MSVYTTLRCWWHAIVHSSRVADDVQEELQSHIAAYAEDLVRQGMDPIDAERKARLDLGRIDRLSERYREAVGLRLWDEIWSDLRYGLRGLLRNPGFAIVSILSLALSIGMATAMYSLVHAVLLDVYPYADSDRTVNPIVFDPTRPNDWDWFVLNRAQFLTYRSSPAFEDVLGLATFGMQLQFEDGEQQVKAVALTANAAPFLRVKPIIGRGLEPSDGDYGARSPNIVVLGYRFWLKQYGGDASVIGRKLTYSIQSAGQKPQSLTIVGVMPERFTLGGTPDFYVPLSQIDSPQIHLVPFAKLKHGITAVQASEAVDSMIHSFAAQDPPQYPKQFQTRLQPIIQGFTDRSKFVHSLPILLAAVAVLLLIGCVNCSILLLARGTSRTHEFALRSAIGASPYRLVRQLLVECFTLSLMGSALGILLSYFLARLPLQLAADLFPSESVVRVDLSVLMFSVSIAIIASLLFGLWPALRFSKPNISQTMQKNNRRTASMNGQSSLRRLIASQIALTLVLLTIAASATTAYIRLVRTPLGYNPSHVIFAAGSYLPINAKTWAERSAKNIHMRDAAAAIPGVAAVAMADNFPPGSPDDRPHPFEIVGAPTHQTLSARLSRVDEGYFSLLQIPLAGGRIWSEEEGRMGLPLAVVNLSFAHRYSPDQNIVGRKLKVLEFSAMTSRFGALPSPTFRDGELEIVGVIADVTNSGLGQPVSPEIYANIHVATFGVAPILIRTSDASTQNSNALRRALHQAGATYIFVSSLSLDEMLRQDETWRRERLTASLFGVFAIAALALSLVGLYSVVAYLVAQRAHEFGIRLALGARRSHIFRLVLCTNLTAIFFGSGIGGFFSVLAQRESSRWLEGIPQNPEAIIFALAVLVIAAVFASLSPGIKAMMTQPNTILHSE